MSDPTDDPTTLCDLMAKYREALRLDHSPRFRQRACQAGIVGSSVTPTRTRRNGVVEGQFGFDSAFGGMGSTDSA